MTGILFKSHIQIGRQVNVMWLAVTPRPQYIFTRWLPTLLASVGRVIFAKISKTQDATNKEVKEVKRLFKICAFLRSQEVHIIQ